MPYVIRPGLTETEKAYLAGLIDGEGSLTLNITNGNRARSGVSTHVAVANTHQGIIKWVGAVTGCGCPVATYNHKKPHHRVLHRWDWASQDALWLLRQIRPYLRIKSKQADVLLTLDRITEAFKRQLGGPFGNSRPLPSELIELRRLTRAILRSLNRGTPLSLGDAA